MTKTPHEEALEDAPVDYVKSFLQVLNDKGTKRILIEGETWSASYGADAIPAIQAAIAAYTERMAGQVSVEAWNDAFLKGFMASGEGYNGEYPFDFTIPDDARGQKWLEMRDRIRSALTATPPASEKDPAE